MKYRVNPCVCAVLLCILLTSCASKEEIIDTETALNESDEVVFEVSHADYLGELNRFAYELIEEGTRAIAVSELFNQDITDLNNISNQADSLERLAVLIETFSTISASDDLVIEHDKIIVLCHETVEHLNGLISILRDDFETASDEVYESYNKLSEKYVRSYSQFAEALFDIADLVQIKVN